MAGTAQSLPAKELAVLDRLIECATLRAFPLPQAVTRALNSAPVVRFRGFLERRELWIFRAIALICCVLTVWLFAPGYMSLDSVRQLEEARSLQFTNMHPVSMALLWALTDRIVPGPLGMLVVINLLFWFGLAVFFRTRPWPLWLRALAIPLLGFFPPILCLSGAVWKDTLMQAMLLGGLGCWLNSLSATTSRRRIAWLCGAGFLMVFAMTARHNAIGSAYAFVALALFSAPLLTRQHLLVRLFLAGVVALPLTLLSWKAAQAALNTISQKGEFWAMSATFDLVGISVRTGRIEIDPETRIVTPGATIRDVRRAYNPFEHLQLYRCVKFRRNRPCRTILHRDHDAASLDAVAKNWRRVVLANPKEYLQHRAAVYALAIGLTDHGAKIWYLNPRGLANDYPLSPRGKALLKWFSSLHSSPIFIVWHYLILAFVCLIAAIVFLYRTGQALPLALSLSSVGYAASIFFGTGAPDYRYSEWSVMATLLTLFSLFASWSKHPAPVATEPISPSGSVEMSPPTTA